jgi:hypothetical protein
MLESKQNALFIFNSHFVVPYNVVDDEGQGRRVCEDIRYGGTICANETEAQVGWRR